MWNVYAWKGCLYRSCTMQTISYSLVRKKVFVFLFSSMWTLSDGQMEIFCAILYIDKKLKSMRVARKTPLQPAGFLPKSEHPHCGLTTSCLEWIKKHILITGCTLHSHKHPDRYILTLIHELIKIIRIFHLIESEVLAKISYLKKLLSSLWWKEVKSFH